MACQWWVLLSLGLLTLPVGAKAQTQVITWQKLIAELATERTKVETCVGLLKKYGNAVEIDQGALQYSQGKAAIDGLIAGLSVTLAQRSGLASLPDLQERLQLGVTVRSTLCNKAHALLPPEKVDLKALIGGFLGGVGQGLPDLLGKVFQDQSKTAGMIETIQQELKATAWPEFVSVPPSP
jgi:hypothetical protein